MGKRRDPAIRAVLRCIEQGHFALVRRSDKHVGLVSSEEMYDKGNSEIRALPSSYSPGLPPTILL
jgi:hypothetical protein